MIHQTSTVDPFSCRVAVYWNLSKLQWSIKTDEQVGEVKKGKVIAYADAEDITLWGATFYVNKGMHAAGLAGTGKRGTKRNVVAWVTGKLAEGSVETDRRVTFHWPDARSTFHYVDTGEPIASADVAVFKTVSQDGKPAGKVWVR